MVIHLAVLAAGSPGHVSDLQYATESWTPGGKVLGAIILVVLVIAWLKVPRGPVIGRRAKPAPAKAKAPARARAAARR